MKRKQLWVISFCLLLSLLLTSCSKSETTGETTQSDMANASYSMANVDTSQDFAKDWAMQPPSKGQESPEGIDNGSARYNTESYNKINDNPFISTQSEPLSTFSIDVDTASYSNIRRYLNQGQLPPADAVRIEEMVNYFTYRYPIPQGEQPFSVNMEMGKCPWNKKHDLVLVGLKGREVDVEDMKGSNLVFLIDTSGSMEDENKLPLLKSSFKILLERLRPQDRISIVTYAGSAGLVLESTPGSEKEKIQEALDNLQSGGSTAGGEGIVLAYKVAKNNFVKGGNNRVILATDGDFNVGASSDAEMERLIEEKRQDGIFLSVIGFGTGNYKDSKMETLADKGNGNYAYIDNLIEAKKVLGQQIWGTLYTIAKDVKIQVDFNPSKIKGYRLIGYENRLLNKEDFHNDKKDAGDIGSGHTITAFYEIIPQGSDEKVESTAVSQYQKSEIIQSENMMSVQLRYKKPDENESQLLKYHVKAEDVRRTELSDNFLFASAVVEFGLLLRDSQYKGTSSFDHVFQLARQSLGRDELGYREEFLALVRVAEGLKK